MILNTLNVGFIRLSLQQRKSKIFTIISTSR